MKRKIWIWIILVLLATLFVWRFVTAKNDKEVMGGNGPLAVAVETGKIEIMDLDETSTFSGNLRAANKYILAPKVSGQLAKLHVNIGDIVHKGQVIAELEDIVYAQEYEKAVANLEQAANALNEAEKDLEYNRQLLAKSFISQAEYDRINAQYITEQSRHRVAQAAKRTAEFQLNQTKVIADWNGGSAVRVIGERFADEGQLLSVGAPLVSVLDISKLIAEIDVIESDYRRIKIGQKATISSDSWPGEKFPGRIARIAPMLQEQSRQARIEIEIPNPNLKLKPGMYARVQLTYQTRKQVTAIPAAAFYKHKGEEGVFVVDADSSIVNFIPVEKGITTKEYIEIISPELQGEVVTLGQDQLDDGRKIILPGTDKASKVKPGTKK